MERNRFSDIAEVLRSRPARVAGSLVVATSFLAGTPETAGVEPSVPRPIPHENFKDFTDLDYLKDELSLEIPIYTSPSVVPEQTEKQLTEKEKKIKEIKDKAKEIYDFAKASDRFSPRLLDQLHDNLPLYLASADKYGLDWVVLWVTQRRESGASDPNSMAFDYSHRNSDVQGSWQLSTSWDQGFRTEAFSGLEYTLTFPQRHKGDARDTATAARILKRNIAKQMKNGRSYHDALSHAIYLYCRSEEEAQKRMKMIARDNKVFGDLAGVRSSK